MDSNETIVKVGDGFRISMNQMGNEALIKLVAPDAGNRMYYPGQFVEFHEKYAPLGFRERNGDVLQDADVEYPALWEELKKAINSWKLISESDWLAKRAAAGGIGGVPYFVLDENAKTIRLPDTRGDFTSHAKNFTQLGQWAAANKHYHWFGYNTHENNGSFFIDRSWDGPLNDLSQRPTTNAGSAIKIEWNGSDNDHNLHEWDSTHGRTIHNNMLTSLEVPNGTSSDVIPRNVGLLGCVYVAKGDMSERFIHVTKASVAQNDEINLPFTNLQHNYEMAGLLKAWKFVNGATTVDVVRKYDNGNQSAFETNEMIEFSNTGAKIKTDFTSTGTAVDMGGWTLYRHDEIGELAQYKYITLVGE